MTRRMLINALEPEEVRVAIAKDNTLEEIYVERRSGSKLVGNIYKGRVVSIEPSIQAAFVDFGIDKNGFLHVSDVMPAYGQASGAGDGKDLQSLLRVGQEVLVQVTKEEIGTKAPTLRTYISIPGRFLVLMPGVQKRGVSKKIEELPQRKRLRSILNDIAPPKGMGYIVRTAGADCSRNELVRDLNYLLNLWRAITARVRSVESPAEIYRESDLVLRSIRDLFSEEIEEVVVDAQPAFHSARGFLGEVMPAAVDRVKLYERKTPMFHHFKIEDRIEKLYTPTVPLPSGGSIVIEQTEALVAIDVNSGKFKDNDNLEETALQTNLEAAKEVCRQLKLRDLGGVICVDFIDMRSDRHRSKIENTVRELLSTDRARTRVARLSRFCILELTRQRVRMSIRRTHYESCNECKGSGSVKTAETMSIYVMRQLKAKITKRKPRRRIEVQVHPDVATYLFSKKHAAIKELEELAGQSITVKSEREQRLEELHIRM